MSYIDVLLNRGVNLESFLASQGRVFYASDADQNDLVTGQTSFANTTPTFLLDVPSGTTAIPLELTLVQSGTVAGGDINVLVEYDNADRYSAGGTAETKLNANLNFTDTGNSVLYTGATASAGYGVRVWGVTVAADVSPAEGAVQEILWRPGGNIFIKGDGALAIYTYASVTGPSWLWSIKWAEIPSTWLT